MNIALEQQKKTNEKTLEIILQDVSMVFDATPENIRAKKCGTKIIAVSVLIAIQIGLEHTAIAEFFGENVDWVESHKDLGSALENDSMYQRAYENSQGSVMAASVLESDGGGLGDLTTDLPPRSPFISSETVSIDTEPVSDICDAVLQKAAKHFEVSTIDIISGNSADEKEMRAKTAVAMKESGASFREIRTAFNAGYDSWFYEQEKKVDPEDGDVAMIKIDASTLPAANTASNGERRVATASADPIEAVLHAAAALFSVPKESITTTNGHHAGRIRYICGVAMKNLGVDSDKITTLFDKAKGWIYRAPSQLDDDEKKQADTIVAQVRSGAPIPQPKALTAQAGVSNPGQKGTLPANVSDAVIQAAVTLLNISKEDVLSGKNRIASKARGKCAMAMKHIGVPMDDILTLFGGKSRNWIYIIQNGLDAEDIGQIKEIVSKVQAEPLASPAPGNSNGHVKSREMVVRPPQPRPDQRFQPPIPAPREPLEIEPVPAMEGVRAIGEKVFAKFCNASLLFSQNPAAEIALAKEMTMFAAADKGAPIEILTGAFEASEEHIQNALGRTFLKLKGDPVLAKKFRSIQRE